MTDITLNLRVLRADGQFGAFLNVQVIERGPTTARDRIYDVGQTDKNGELHNAVVRPVRTIGLFGMAVESPFDRPTLDARISDAFGHSITTRVRPFVVAQTVSLPENFNRVLDEPATDPVLAPGSPSDLIDRAVRPFLNSKTPGYVFIVRKNGTLWANDTRGFARINGLGAHSRAMTNDTIIQLASMSKPITATALVAMIDDWTAIRNAVSAIGHLDAPVTRLRLTIPRLLLPPVQRWIVVPTVLAPLFADRTAAEDFLTHSIPSTIGAEVRDGLQQVVRGAGVWPMPVVPPGHFGLLARHLRGAALLDYGHPFLPLIRKRLGMDVIAGRGVANITIENLMTHHTDLADANGDRQLASNASSVPQPMQPPGGLATNDYWAFMRQLLREPCHATTEFHYSNHNYTLLTMVIEACTDTTFDDYVTRRLFSDPRFSHIRRHVVEPNLGALYYTGTPSSWAGGVQFSDYTNWPGNGGVYVSALQFTDWMHVLYERLPVAGNGEDAPLVSATGHSNLFGTRGLFSLGRSTIDDGPAAARVRFQHNGGVGGNGGSVSGNLAIIVPPGGSSYTALFVANGDLTDPDPSRNGADAPFTAAIDALFA